MLEPVARPPMSASLLSEERCTELLQFLLFGARGGPNRGRILLLLLERPQNAHEIAKRLGLNYGTVKTHLTTLMGAGLVVALTSSRYARGYALAPVLRRNPRALQGLLGPAT